MARRNDFLEGVQRGFQSYLQTKQMMQQSKSAELNQQYMAEMTNRMKQEKTPQWGSTPETYEQKIQIDRKYAPPAKEAKPEKWYDSPEGYERKKAIDAKFKTTPKGKEEKPSIFENYGVTAGDKAALDKAIRANSKGTQQLGYDKEGDLSVVKAEGAPKSPRIDPIKLGDEKMGTAVTAFLEDEFPNLKISEVPGTGGKMKAFPPEVIKQVKYFFARSGITEKDMNDLRGTLAAVQIVDIDNADLLAGDKALANHIRNRIDAWKTKGESLFQNVAAPKSIEEASAQVRQWVPMMKNAAR